MSANEGYRLVSWGDPLRWETWELGPPAPGEVQIEVEACGVGRTVVNYVRGDNWNDASLLPRVPGHEVVGRIAAVGEGVAREVGERVLAYFYLSCFSCRQCLAGREARCERIAGRYGVHRDGGYARRSNLPEGNAIAFGDDVEPAPATVIPDACATSIHVCRSRVQLEPGERVVVVGAAGGVGAHMVQVARTCGAEVLGLDRGAVKLELVEQLGARAEDSTSFDDVDLAGWGGAADAVIDLVGTAASFRWAMSHVGQGGRVCVLSAVPGVAEPVAPRDLVMRESSIVGSHYASRSEVRSAARLVAAGDVQPVVTEVGPPDALDDLLDAVREGSLLGRAAIVWRDAA